MLYKTVEYCLTLSFVYCPLFIVLCLLSLVYCPLFIVPCLLSLVYCPLFLSLVVPCCSLFLVYCPLLIVPCVLQPFLRSYCGAVWLRLRCIRVCQSQMSHPSLESFSSTSSRLTDTSASTQMENSTPRNG